MLEKCQQFHEKLIKRLSMPKLPKYKQWFPEISKISKIERDCLWNVGSQTPCEASSAPGVKWRSLSWKDERKQRAFLLP